MQIRNVLSADATPVSKNMSLQQAAQHLMSSDKGLLWVMEDDVALGVVTHASMTRAVAGALDPHTATAGQVMDEAIITLRPEQDAHDARQLMHDSRIAYALVREADGAPVGTVILRDLDARFHHEGGRIFGFGTS